MEDIWKIELQNSYRGLNYIVCVNQELGYRCGYVSVPKDHPLYEKSFSSYNFKPIMLTFSGHMRSFSNDWYIGWDHHHIYDGVDEVVVLEYFKDLPEDEREKKLTYAQSFINDPYNLVASKGDVERECEEVIDYLIENKDYEFD